MFEIKYLDNMNHFSKIKIRNKESQIHRCYLIFYTYATQ